MTLVLDETVVGPLKTNLDFSIISYSTNYIQIVDIKFYSAIKL